MSSYELLSALWVKKQFYMLFTFFNWDDPVKFEVIIQTGSQTTEIIGMIKGYPRNHHFYYSNRGEIQPGHL